jgi:hypothetical protein
MKAEIVTALIAASGAVALAGTTYWFTKKREREAEIRKEKLQHYKDLISSFSGIIAGEGTPEGQRAYSRACNNLNLIAPQSVIEAMQAFQEASKAGSETPDNETHDRALSRLILEMRKDLHVLPKDDENTFRVRLWASGTMPKRP